MAGVTGPGEATSAAAARASAAARSGTSGAVPLAFPAAALPEEVVFRGALLLLPANLLGWPPATSRRAAAAGVVLFAALHAPYGAPNVATAFVAGTAYAVLALRSGSLWPPVLAHG